MVPYGIRKTMNWIKDHYGAELPIYITENGVSDRQGNLDDLNRIYYYKHYLNQLLKCKKKPCLAERALSWQSLLSSHFA